MSQQDITPAEALTRLGASTAEAIAQVLETLAPGIVERGEVSVLSDGSAPFTNITPGSVASSVSYVDGVTGGNIFVLAPAGARALATAMGAPPEQDEVDGEAVQLSELEISAVAEAANQTMAAAAGAIGVVLGQEIEIGHPDTRVLENAEDAIKAWGTAPHATSTTFLIGGEPCRLIQLVPNAFVVRMVRAIDELSAEDAAATAMTDGGGGEPSSVGLREALGDVNLRVWAELGRTELPLGRALTLPLGAVVDLDSAADAPVDLYVNGLLYGQGQLFVTDDGEWAVQLRHVATQSTLKGALI